VEPKESLFQRAARAPFYWYIEEHVVNKKEMKERKTENRSTYIDGKGQDSLY